MALKRKSGYTTNDNFTVSDNDDQNGSSAPQAKRSKKTGEANSSHFTTALALTAPKKDNENNLYWEISKARRVTISEFKGKKMVSIREYYEKDGDWLPGKKGISLTLEQYAGLVGVLPGIENALRKSGVQDVPRPDYSRLGGDGGSTKVEQEDETEESEEERDAGGRANHEATSDEEE